MTTAVLQSISPGSVSWISHKGDTEDVRFLMRRHCGGLLNGERNKTLRVYSDLEEIQQCVIDLQQRMTRSMYVFAVVVDNGWCGHKSGDCPVCAVVQICERMSNVRARHLDVVFWTRTQSGKHARGLEAICGPPRVLHRTPVRRDSQSKQRDQHGIKADSVRSVWNSRLPSTVDEFDAWGSHCIMLDAVARRDERALPCGYRDVYVKRWLRSTQKTPQARKTWRRVYPHSFSAIKRNDPGLPAPGRKLVQQYFVDMVRAMHPKHAIGHREALDVIGHRLVFQCVRDFSDKKAVDAVCAEADSTHWRWSWI